MPLMTAILNPVDPPGEGLKETLQVLLAGRTPEVAEGCRRAKWATAPDVAEAQVGEKFDGLIYKMHMIYCKCSV